MVAIGRALIGAPSHRSSSTNPPLGLAPLFGEGDFIFI